MAFHTFIRIFATNMKQLMTICMLVVLLLPIQAQNLQQRLDSLTADPMFETSQLGLMVWDMTTDSLLYARNAQQTMRPASTMKLLTAISALDYLGGNYQFTTSLYYQGTIHQHTLEGDLIVVGGMDPEFNIVGLREFIDSLQHLGIDTLRGSIVADRSFKDTLMWGEGWCWDDENPPLTPLLMNRKDNMVERFIDELQKAGIVLDNITVKTEKCPNTAFLICQCKHSIDQILMRMLKDSDNLYAECLFYQLAAYYGMPPARAIHARSLEKQLINHLGLEYDNYRFADGSGLSLYNYVSAEMLTQLLRYAWKTESIRIHLLPALPIAGEDGTLAKRMKRTAAAGNVRAKTGTLSGISSLAGYLTTDAGHQLCFCIINQGVMRNRDGRDFQDRLCQALCEPITQQEVSE